MRNPLKRNKPKPAPVPTTIVDSMSPELEVAIERFLAEIDANITK